MKTQSKFFTIGAVTILSVVTKIASAQNVGINTTGATPASTNMFEVLQPGTAANSVGIWGEHSGAVAGGTGYAFQAIKSGASLNNIAAYLTASGATNNYALIIPPGGGLVGINTITPTATALLTINPTTNAVRTGIDMSFPGSGTISSTAYGINIGVAANQNIRGFLYSNSSGGAGVFYGVGTQLTGGTTAEGYLSYRSGSPKTYAVYGVGGDYAGYFTNKVTITGNSSPDGVADLEVQNPASGSGNPATLSIRPNQQITTSGNAIANLNFGTSYSTNPQAQIQVVREAASSSSADVPTAMTFSTIADGFSTLTERVRIMNNGNVGIGVPGPNNLLQVSNLINFDDANTSTSLGYQAGKVNVAAGNTFVGYNSGQANTSAIENTSIGLNALYSNAGAGGNYNVAVGTNALKANTVAKENTAVGAYALYNQTGAGGDYNVAAGSNALINNTTGSINTSIGAYSLQYNTTGDHNTALGANAGSFSSPGATAAVQCTYIGADIAGGNYTNATAVGYKTVPAGTNTMCFGNTFVTSIGGTVGWGVCSDARYKKDVQENVPGLAFITKLRPVTYHHDMIVMNKIMYPNDSCYSNDSETQAGKMLRTGFIAQEVEKAALELGYDFSGVDKHENGYYGLRYAEFTVPLVKAVQEQQQIIERLNVEIEIIKSENSNYDARIRKLEDILYARTAK